MCGVDTALATDWISSELRAELMHALSVNADLYPALIDDPTWEQRIEHWQIPKQYIDLNIVEYVKSLARSPQDLTRINWELAEFEQRSLTPVLKTIKYLIDVMKEHNVVWGVGRGSSVSSLVLFLMGVHKIDPIKWNLDPTEFFK